MKGSATKQRWQECEQLAALLGISKWEISNFLYKEIKEAGLMTIQDRGVACDVEAIKKLPAFIDLQKKKETEEEKTQVRREVFGINDAASNIRLAMWFIAKFESPDQALAVLTAAVGAVKACQPAKT